MAVPILLQPGVSCRYILFRYDLSKALGERDVAKKVFQRRFINPPANRIMASSTCPRVNFGMAYIGRQVALSIQASSDNVFQAKIGNASAQPAFSVKREVAQFSDSIRNLLFITVVDQRDGEPSIALQRKRCSFSVLHTMSIFELHVSLTSMHDIPQQIVARLPLT